MSRSNLAKSNGEYVGKDFSRYVASLDKSNRELGKVLGVSGQRVGQKRKTDTWTLKDAVKLFKAGDASDDEILRLMRV